MYKLPQNKNLAENGNANTYTMKELDESVVDETNNDREMQQPVQNL